MYTFGINLRRIRKEAEMSQTELAKKLNVNQSTISRYEGNDAYPNLDVVYDIAKVLGVKAEDLIKE